MNKISIKRLTRTTDSKRGAFTFHSKIKGRNKVLARRRSRRVINNLED